MAITYHGGNILRGTTAERTGGTFTNLPAGWIYIESDGLAIYRWNGTTWDAIGHPGGTLSVANGGTGAATFTAGILKGSGTSAFTTVAAPSGAVVGTTDTQTLTGKTLSAASNTIKVPFLFIANRATAVTQLAWGSPWVRNDSGWTIAPESQRQIPLTSFNLDPILLTVKVVTQSANNSVVVTFRDDGANVTNSTVTILSTDAAGTIKSSSAITATIAAGSLIDWQVDSTAVTVGSANIEMILEGYMYK